jgi:hypothetical protein
MGIFSNITIFINKEKHETHIKRFINRREK